MLIYKITNTVNNKIYIGQTKMNEREFFLSNYFGSGVLIKKAIKKYGKKNFLREILWIGKFYKELSVLEKLFIKKYGTLIPNGYNIHEGGCELNKLLDEIRSKKLKGRKFTEEHKKKISLSNTGKKFSKKTRIKISETQKKRFINPKNNPRYIDGRSLKKYYCNCGKEIRWQTAIYGSRKCYSCCRKNKSLQERGHKINCLCPFCRRKRKEPLSTVILAKIRAKVLGQKRPNQSQAMKGRFTGKNNPMFGKTRSEEFKQIKRDYFNSNKNPGKNKTEETKRKISESKKGKPGISHTEEYKKFMSTTMKEIWRKRKCQIKIE